MKLLGKIIYIFSIIGIVLAIVMLPWSLDSVLKVVLLCIWVFACIAFGVAGTIMSDM